MKEGGEIHPDKYPKNGMIELSFYTPLQMYPLCARIICIHERSCMLSAFLVAMSFHCAFNFAFNATMDPAWRTNLVQRYIKPACFYVKLPDQSVIKDRLLVAGLVDVAEKTKIDEQLANKTVYYRDVESNVDSCFFRYNIERSGLLTSALECATPYKVAEILLADHPALIAKIKAEKVIEHSKLPIIPL
jgi:hypothetical protein